MADKLLSANRHPNRAIATASALHYVPAQRRATRMALRLRACRYTCY